MTHGHPSSLPEEPQIVVLCNDRRTPPPQLQPLATLAGSVTFADRDNLAAALPSARALLMWDVSDVLRHHWNDADELQWVQVAAAGIDMILFDALVRSDVVLTNARGVFDLAIAEFVASAVLAFVKEWRHLAELQAQQQWKPRQLGSVAGSTALIIGTGSVGRAIARLLRSLGMTVRGAGRTSRDDDVDFDRIVDSNHLATHVGWADHLIVAAPLTDRTRNLINAPVFDAMRPSAHLINVARGQIVNEDDLLTALHAGSLAGATLDVFHTEPLPPDHALWTTPAVTITPHLAGDTLGFEDAMGQLFLDNAERWLRHHSLHNVVDKQSGFVHAPNSAKLQAQSLEQLITPNAR